jgi:glyoxylase-like metal-dependent hydrolase (beta-lactamase superfamily II)
MAAQGRQLGEVTIARALEIVTPFDPAMFFPEVAPEEWAPHRSWLEPDAMDPASGALLFPVQSYLLRTPHHTVLIDSCVGNHKDRPNRPFWHQKCDDTFMRALAALEVAPADIDYVMCSHLHVDHVGWNTRLENGRWVPTFPNAKYVFSRADYDHYLKLDGDPATGPVNQGSFRDSVIPIVEARLSQMVDGVHTVDEHLSLDPRPGHTPGTVAINLASRGQKALFCGDILHHAIQVYHPEWNSFACADQVNARKSRRQVLEDCAGSGALLMPAHFGAPFVCRVDHKGGSFTPRFGA